MTDVDGVGKGALRGLSAEVSPSRNEEAALRELGKWGSGGENSSTKALRRAQLCVLEGGSLGGTKEGGQQGVHRVSAGVEQESLALSQMGPLESPVGQATN